MRRNAESLLVLAGAEPPRRRGRPVAWPTSSASPSVRSRTSPASRCSPSTRRRSAPTSPSTSPTSSPSSWRTPRSSRRRTRSVEVVGHSTRDGIRALRVRPGHRHERRAARRGQPAPGQPADRRPGAVPLARLHRDRPPRRPLRYHRAPHLVAVGWCVGARHAAGTLVDAAAKLRGCATPTRSGADAMGRRSRPCRGRPHRRRNAAPPDDRPLARRAPASPTDLVPAPGHTPRRGPDRRTRSNRAVDAPRPSPSRPLPPPAPSANRPPHATGRCDPPAAPSRRPPSRRRLPPPAVAAEPTGSPAAARRARRRADAAARRRAARPPLPARHRCPIRAAPDRAPRRARSRHAEPARRRADARTAAARSRSRTASPAALEGLARPQPEGRGPDAVRPTARRPGVAATTALARRGAPDAVALPLRPPPWQDHRLETPTQKHGG